MLTALHKTPFPYFGGKSDAASTIWAALGDVAHYCEPFMGSLAALLRRPHPCNRPYSSETVNDLDGALCNAFRSIQWSPEATADAASWPVSEADLTARHLALVRWREERQLLHLMGDPSWHDPVMAGWWIWGISSWIAGGWCDGTGPWTADADGILWRQGATPRQPGVTKRRPHLSDDGRGVYRPGTREPGVHTKLPRLGDNGIGVHRPGTREPGVGDPEYHPMTMPEVRRWFQFLAARLRHVRIVHGDWQRVVTPAVLQTLPVRMKGKHCGVFLDPPYGEAAQRGAKIYREDSLTVAETVRAWCLAYGDNPRYRIALAGFVGEHEELQSHGWRVVEWFEAGHLKGGLGDAQHKERLWLSPHTLRPVLPGQRDLFGEGEEAT